MSSKFLFILSLLVSSAWAQENQTWHDFKYSISLFTKGSIAQFTQKNNLYVLAAGVPIMTYSFSEDDRIVDLISSKEEKGYIEIFNDIGTITSFPFLSIGFYTFGRQLQNEKLTQFSLEYFSSMYLAMAESGLLSFIPIHKRPDSSDLNKYETNFRGNSSFPSGHVIPLMALSFKTWQFYGVGAALVPAVLSGVVSYQRVHSRKHYFSDVTGSLLLSAWASEGVRAAAGKNHLYDSSYQKWVAKNLNFRPLFVDESIRGIELSMEY